MIRQIPPQDAQELCDKYAEEYQTGKFSTNGPDADGFVWIGHYNGVNGILSGVCGFREYPDNRVRFLLSWHVAPTRNGTYAAGKLLDFCFSTMPAGWTLQGNVTPRNERARRFLEKRGYLPVGIIYTKNKQDTRKESNGVVSR